MKQKVIFCVDDEKIVLNSLKAELKNIFGNQYIIETAESGTVALEAIQALLDENIEIPVIIVDYAMPLMKGDELLIRMKELSPRTVKVLLTGQATLEGITNTINMAGLYRYIAKPWDPNDLILSIQQALKSYDQANQIKTQNQELTALSKSLELKVASRTAELEKVNLQLVAQQQELLDKNNELYEYQNHLEDLVQNRTKELEIAKEQAEKSDHLKTAFLANMSHEIRTPMNAILGFSELLMEDDLSTESKDEYHQIINKSGKRLMNLISDIIDVAKIESQSLTITYQVFNLNALLDTIYQQFAINSVFTTVKLKLIKSLNNENSFILSDETRLAQVISNLIENAYKFTREGCIEFGYTTSNNLIHYYVKDNGVGIESKDHQLIFERFGQSDNELNNIKAGTGIGLSISKGLVELLGGTMGVSSEVNKGSTFYFDLPFNPTADDEVPSPEPTQERTIPINETVKTILIAEDEETNYIYIQEVLKQDPFHLIRVENGQEAVDLIKSNAAIDLILMDVNMPIMDGIEATKEIRAFNSTVPIIALTAYAMVGDQERVLSVGCNDYLSKPVSKKNLLARIYSNISIPILLK